MKITPRALRYFRTAPLPTKQPKQSNRRTDRGENKLSIEFANYLKAKTLEGKCKAVWTKIAHETAAKPRTFKTKSGQMIKICAFGNLMRNMGKNAGVPDFIFTWEGEALWLELKDGKDAKLSDDQEFFREWCLETKAKHEIAWSLNEAIYIVERYGICRQ